MRGYALLKKLKCLACQNCHSERGLLINPVQQHFFEILSSHLSSCLAIGESHSFGRHKLYIVHLLSATVCIAWWKITMQYHRYVVNCTRFRCDWRVILSYILLTLILVRKWFCLLFFFKGKMLFIKSPLQLHTVVDAAAVVPYREGTGAGK
jgi:hypothetical protein